MNLINALIVSAIITTSIWLVAVFQPGTAQAKGLLTKADKVINAENPVVKTSVVNNDVPRFINGISAHLPMTEVNNLWQAFNNSQTLTNQLKKQPKAVYVLYQDFSADFSKAEITIGYASDLIRQPSELVALDNNYQNLLPRAKYSDGQLASVWRKIDYRKAISSVLEIHYLDDNNAVTSNEVLVSYQESN